MKIKLLFIASLIVSFAVNAQSCPGTLANQTTTTDPFFKIDQGTTNCTDWPMTITIDGSVFQRTSCNGANLEYTLVSGAPLADANNFVANFGFGDCTYVNGVLSEQTLSTTQFENTNFSMYPNPIEKNRNVTLSFGINFTGELFLYDVNGTLIRKHVIKGQSSDLIETTALHSGLYIVKITSENRQMTKKLIIY